jgi:hypothetical protein
MICGRSAYLMLITCTLLGAPSRGEQVAGAPSDPIRSGITCHTESSINWLTSFRPSRPTTLSRFIPWKSRQKIVLGETIQEINDECDLGPAVPPDRRTTPAGIELAAPSPSNRLPLRC